MVNAASRVLLRATSVMVVIFQLTHDTLLRQFLDSKADVSHTTHSKGRSPLIDACEEGPRR